MTDHESDFDFDFIHSTITLSSEGIKNSLVACLEEIQNSQEEAELVNEDIAAQI